MTSKDLMINELRAQNEQLKSRVKTLEKNELDCFVLLIQAKVPLFKNGDEAFEMPYSLPERVKILTDKVK